MPLYRFSVTRRKAVDAQVNDETYVVASTRSNALVAFELPLSAQQRQRIESINIEEVSATVLTGA
jgi:hypothetical protein